MNDTGKSSEQGRNKPFAFLNQTSVARWAPIPLRLIVGYRFMQHGFAKLSKAPDAFVLILQKATRVNDRVIYGKVKNGRAA